MHKTLIRVLLLATMVVGGWGAVFAAPTITSVTVLDGELKEESRLLIRGDGFGTEKNGVSVRIGNYSTPVEQVAPMELWVRLPKNAQSGDITVQANRETSNKYYFDIPRPVIHYVYREGGLLPGSKVEIGGERILRSGTTTEVFFEGTPLQVHERNFAEQRLTVELPKKTLNGTIEVLTNGFRSQPVRIDIVEPFYITGVSPAADRTIEVRGVFPVEGTPAVYIDNTSLKVQQQSTTRIVAELPSGNVPISGGMVTVRYGNKKSTGVPLSTERAPTIYEIGDINRYVNNNRSGESTVFYEVEILVFGEASGTEIYMNGRQMPVARRLASSIYVKTEEIKTSDARRAPFPVTGTMFAVKNGNKGNEFTYDVSDRMAPVLYRVEAPEGFGSRKKLILWGQRLGDTPSELVINSSLGLQMNEETKQPIILSHSSTRIEFRLPDTNANSGNVSVQVRGTRSNEISFPMNGPEKEVGRNPQITGITYTQGHAAGAEILIEGDGFSEVAKQNIVYFGTEQVIPHKMNGEIGMYVRIPAGAKSGTITAEIKGRKTNTYPVTVVTERRTGVEFFFEEPTLLRVDTDGTKGTALVGIGVRNTYHHAVLSKLRLDINFVDAAEKTNPYAVAQTGLLPIDRVELTLGGKSYSSIVRRTGAEYFVEFSGIEIPVQNEKQLMQVQVMFMPYVASGSEISFTLNPTDTTYISGSFPDAKQTYEAVVGKKQPALQSTVVRVFSPRHDCIEVDTRGTYCVKRMAGIVEETPTITVEPPKTPVQEQRTPTVLEEERIIEQTPAQEETPKETGVGRTVGSILPFVDTEMVAWAQDALYALVQAKVISGYTDQGKMYFRPEQAVTRAELVKMMLEVQQAPVHTAKDTWPFTDVRGNDWYVPYIAYAKEQGMIQGYTDGNFRPNAVVTRAEAIKILLSVAGEDLRGTAMEPRAFRDVQGWALPWIQKAVAMGVVKGYADGTFAPEEALNRVEAAQMVASFLP